jgi:hypothetical protein
MRRAMEYALVAFVLVVFTAGWVGFLRWYTDGTPDCANCDPE